MGQPTFLQYIHVLNNMVSLLKKRIFVAFASESKRNQTHTFLKHLLESYYIVVRIWFDVTAFFFQFSVGALYVSCFTYSESGDVCVLFVIRLFDSEMRGKLWFWLMAYTQSINKNKYCLFFNHSYFREYFFKNMHMWLFSGKCNVSYDFVLAEYRIGN